MRISEVSKPKEVEVVNEVPTKTYKTFGLGDFGRDNWDILADRLNNPSYTIPPKNTSNDDCVSDLDN